MKRPRGTDLTPAEPVGTLAAVGDTERADQTWQRLTAAAAELAGADTADARVAADAQLRQHVRSAGIRRLIDEPLVPSDAGEHTEALTRILQRIPPGWGRWISCQAGWYPILSDLDERLTGLLGDYEVHQIKEKYGRLVYDVDLPDVVTDPADPEPADPGPDGTETDWRAWEQAYGAWQQRLDVYLTGPAGRAHADQVAATVRRAEQLIDDAQRRSQSVCERCGAAGRGALTSTGPAIHQTLCDRCCERHGMIRPAG